MHVNRARVTNQYSYTEYRLKGGTSRYKVLKWVAHQKLSLNRSCQRGKRQPALLAPHTPGGGRCSTYLHTQKVAIEHYTLLIHCNIIVNVCIWVHIFINVLCLYLLISTDILPAAKSICYKCKTAYKQLHICICYKASANL